jgi:hypothetical protein
MAKDDRMPKIFLGRSPEKREKGCLKQRNESERVEDVSRVVMLLPGSLAPVFADEVFAHFRLQLPVIGVDDGAKRSFGRAALS